MTTPEPTLAPSKTVYWIGTIAAICTTAAMFTRGDAPATVFFLATGMMVILVLVVVEWWRRRKAQRGGDQGAP